MSQNPQLLRVYQALSSLTLFQDLKQDPAIQCYGKIIETAALNENIQPICLLSDYHRLASLLIEGANKNNLSPSGNLWQNYLLNSMLLADHLFARSVADGVPVAPFLKEAFLHDLRNLQTLLQEGVVVLKELFKKQIGILPLSLATDSVQASYSKEPVISHFAQLKGQLLESNNWQKQLDAFIKFYRRAGVGSFALYRAFHWEETPGPGGYGLVGIEHTDPQRINQLIGYERQRQQVLDNTERLLAGKAAHNLLLYGDRGTGKSSTVKALLHEYGDAGLRLVQVPRKNLGGLQKLTRYLGKQPLKFIVFIDDLSFEDSETEYKEFKTQLEGSLEQQPTNVCIYVTSNQRHLIKENFGDRHMKETNGEVHPGDTMQEKLSLTDRFGLKITFLAPDKTAFLEIVRQLAIQENIQIETGLLEKLALQWTLWNNERSGRTARQFIDTLKDRDNYDLFL